MRITYPKSDWANMKFHEIQAALSAMTRAQANALADAAGVPKATIAHIRKARTENPRIETVEKLMAVFGKKKRGA